MSPAAVRKLRLAAYALAVMAGLWLPASKIIFHALPLHEPAVYRFAASCPYDAGDPFRGRYVALRLEALPLAVSAARQLPDGRVFLALARGADGLAAAAAVSAKPFKDRDFIAVGELYAQSSKSGTVWYAQPPLDSYYSGLRFSAHDRETLGQLFRSGRHRCAAVVKVYGDGSCEAAGLEVDGRPLESWLGR